MNSIRKSKFSNNEDVREVCGIVTVWVVPMVVAFGTGVVDSEILGSVLAAFLSQATIRWSCRTCSIIIRSSSPVGASVRENESMGTPVVGGAHVQRIGRFGADLPWGVHVVKLARFVDSVTGLRVTAGKAFVRIL